MPARLPRLRQGRRVLAARLQLPLRPFAERMIDDKNTAAEQDAHRDHILSSRPLHHVLALRSLHARSVRHRGTDCQSIAATVEIDIFPGERATTSWPATRLSLPGHRWPKQDFLLQAAAFGTSDAKRSAPLHTALQRPPRLQQDIV